MQTKQKNQLIKPVLLILFTIGFVFYLMGYRITSEFSFGKVGTITLNTPYKETTIYVNSNEKIVTDADTKVVEITLTPKTHKIIVSLKDFYPWTKDVKVPSGGKLELNPLYVPQNPSGFLIGQLDPEYYQIKQSIAKNKVLPESTPIMHKDGVTKIFVDKNTIYVTKNEKTEEVLKSEVKIKSIDFYKNRNDVVIFSAGNSIYAIEIDKAGTQNFMPIYKGQDPYFVNETDNTIFVEDNMVLMQVVI